MKKNILIFRLMALLLAMMTAGSVNAQVAGNPIAEKVVNSVSMRIH